MNKPIKNWSKLLIALFTMNVAVNRTIAQIAKTQVVQLQAKANMDGSLTLEWPKETFTGSYVIYKREPEETIGNWSNAIATVDASTNKYTDNSFKVGGEREYLVAKIENSKTVALGYIQAGNKTKPKPNQGGVIVLIDSAYILALSSEIIQLKNDLIASGWIPYEMYAGRNEKVTAIKDRLSKFMDSKIERPKTLYIVGHVPVPYSGNFSSKGDRPPPDGHVEGAGNHTGAWPADVYYGDFAGVYSDRSVTCTTGAYSRHHNIPNDGKFDQSYTYENIELEIGRVDFYDMPLFGGNDTLLTKEYLNRVHDWRLSKIPFTSRALIDNNFTGLNLASTGYHNLPTFVGLDSVFDNRDYFTAQNNGSYLWSYGCGAGSYTSCSGIGSSNDFALNKGKFSNIFTLLAGSFFGDWDSQNNFMRSSLAAGSLACAWGGIPKWYLHHMGLGYNIGMGARLTQNNFQGYFDGGFNGSGRGVHIALLGDPTLTMIPVSAPKNVIAKSMNGAVTLSWNKPTYGKVTGYYIYLFDKSTGKYTLASEIRCPGLAAYTTDTFFTDNCNWSTGNYTYAVRAMSNTQTGSGIYENLSMAAFADVAHTNSSGNVQTTSISVYPNPAAEFISVNGIDINQIQTIRLVSMEGKVLFSASGSDLINSNSMASFQIPVQNIGKGSFALEVIQSRNHKTFKVIIP